MADQTPDISQGVPLPAYNKPTGGPFSKQRQQAQNNRRRVTKQKQNAADGPSPCIPGTGLPPGDS